MRRQQEWQITKNRQASKSRNLCPYCHTYHYKSEMLDGICPKMRKFALKQQQKYAYICNKCQGEGSFQETVETKILQNAKKFEERWKLWMQNLESYQNQGKAPERKTIRTDLKSREVVCEQCEGHGSIFRMINKKENQNAYGRGPVAYRMPSQTASINPVWIKYRMKPRYAQDVFHCSICLADGGTSDKHFKLNCTHQFHYGCIFKWIKLNTKCPICRQVDPFIDIKQIEPERSISLGTQNVIISNQMRLLNQMLRDPILESEVDYNPLILSGRLNRSRDTQLADQSWVMNDDQSWVMNQPEEQ